MNVELKKALSAAQLKKLPVNQKGHVPITFVKGRGKPWLVTTYKDGGEKVRSFHATAQEAARFWTSTRTAQTRLGQQHITFTPAEFEEWHAAKQLAGGASLVRIVKEWKARAGEVDRMLEACMREFLGAKRETISEMELAKLRHHLEELALHFPGRRMGDITAAHLRTWLNAIPKVSPRTVRNYRESVSRFYNYAVRYGWTNENPAAKVHDSDLPKLIAKSRPVLDIAQATALLRAVEKHYDELVPHFAIRLFAGVRTAEVEKMRAQWIDRKHHRIIIPAHICKTADDWVIQTAPAILWTWLSAYPPPAGRLPRPTETEWSKIKTAAGFGSTFPNWPPNACRKTFATMHLSLLGSPDKTTEILRHASASMLNRNYRGKLVPASVARKFFQIAPQNK